MPNRRDPRFPRPRSARGRAFDEFTDFAFFVTVVVSVFAFIVWIVAFGATVSR